MNSIDLIVCLVVVLAVWNGWRQGFIVQICSLAGIVAGIWLAARFGSVVGGWLRLDPEIAVSQATNDTMYPYSRTFSIGADITF